MDTQYYTYDLPASSDSGRSDRPYRRARSRRRRAKSSRRKGLLVLLLAAAVAGLLWWRFGPRPYYTAQQLGIPVVTSPNDGDGDGVEDYADMVAGIRAYFDTKPHYASKYYAGGYPDDGLGVCTDVVWQGFRAAGYQLKELVDGSRNIVFFGGAGVSTESNIPDFRSADGLYKQKYRYSPEQIVSHSFFMQHTEEFYDFYKEKMMFLDAKPNKAHLKLAELEAAGRRPCIRLRCPSQNYAFEDAVFGPFSMTLEACGGDFAVFCNRVCIISYNATTPFRGEGDLCAYGCVYGKGEFRGVIHKYLLGVVGFITDFYTAIACCACRSGG